MFERNCSACRSPSFRQCQPCSRAEAVLAAGMGKTVQAANKEGRLNLHVGRYGTEVFLNEFRKEYPEIKVVTVNGTAPAPFFILDGIAKAMENMGHHAAKTRL